MLSGNTFYYQLTKRYVTLFGNMFNSITVVRRNTVTNAEIQRIKVPLVYGPKEKYITRMESNPEHARETQVTLPRMSFEMKSMTYDSARAQNGLLKIARGDNATRVASQYVGVPYNLEFELAIYTRYIDDGTHIVEQILPYFNPDYTVSMIPISSMGYVKDIPIILNSVAPSVEYEGDYDSVRYAYWNLNFTIKAYYFGPITTPKIIRKVITNIYNDPALQAGYIIRANMGEGNNGTYRLDDIVYQGPDQRTATCYGVVIGWDQTVGKLHIGGAQGQFKLGIPVKASSTNANYQIVTFDSSPFKLAEIVIEPNPIDAEPDDDYGYSTTITEYGGEMRPPIGNPPVNDGPATFIEIIVIDDNLNVGGVVYANQENDPDGDLDENEDFQWLRDGVAISGATENPYTFTVDDIGANISCRMTYTDAEGFIETVTTDEVGPITSGTTPTFNLTAGGAGAWAGYYPDASWGSISGQPLDGLTLSFFAENGSDGSITFQGTDQTSLLTTYDIFVDGQIVVPAGRTWQFGGGNENSYAFPSGTPPVDLVIGNTYTVEVVTGIPYSFTLTPVHAPSNHWLGPANNFYGYGNPPSGEYDYGSIDREPFGGFKLWEVGSDGTRGGVSFIGVGSVHNTALAGCRIYINGTPYDTGNGWVNDGNGTFMWWDSGVPFPVFNPASTYLIEIKP